MSLFRVQRSFTCINRMKKAKDTNRALRAGRWQSSVETMAKRSVHITYSALTDVGRERSQNEDCLGAYHLIAANCANLAACGFFVVSDGMGGHNAGEIASMAAIRSVIGYVHRQFFQKMTRSVFYRFPDHVYNYHFRKTGSTVSPPAPSRVLVRAFQKANAEVIDLSRKNPAFFGMGATLTAALLVDRKMTVANLGDSRCYVYENEHLSQVTRDHTIVNQMVALGKITEAEAVHHPGKNFLYKSLGSDEVIELDIFEHELHPPAWVLLCSDGLSNMVSDTRILDVLRGSQNPSSAARKLIRLANRAGGKDNISVIVVRVAC